MTLPNWVDAPWRSPAARANRIGAAVMLALGALDAWFFQRWNVNPDGVSYVDLARAFAEHGPTALVNGYWSPLFPALLGAVYKVVPPTMDTMYRLAHALTFAIFVATTFVFARMLRAFTARSAAFRDATPAEQVICVALAWAAYALLVLKGVGVSLVTPDMGVSLLAFWVATEMLALLDAPWGAARWVRLGVALGLGYWWKAILFPVGLVAFAACVLVAWRRRDRLRSAALGAVAFGAVALALIAPVSRVAGRPTFSETGRLNYLWYVNSAPYVWERCRAPGIPDAQAAKFGRILLDSVLVARPLTCLLPEPAPEATMPLWYDPSLWYREAHVRFDAAQQLRAIRNNVVYLVDAFALAAPVLFPAFVAFGLLALARGPGGGTFAVVPLGALALAPLAFYLIVYVELRHVSPFLAIACVAVPLALLRSGGRHARTALGALALLALGDAAVRLSTQTLIELTFVRRALQGRLPDRNSMMWHVARALRDGGLASGARVASINDLWNAEWAQLARLRVRAQVPDLSVSVVHVARALAEPCTAAAWAGSLRGAGIEAVVARFPVGVPVPAGFARIENTEFAWLRVATVPPCPAGAGATTRSFSGTASSRTRAPPAR